jgi:hypothetical protein
VYVTWGFYFDIRVVEKWQRQQLRSLEQDAFDGALLVFSCVIGAQRQWNRNARQMSLQRARGKCWCDRSMIGMPCVCVHQSKYKSEYSERPPGAVDESLFRVDQIFMPRRALFYESLKIFRAI